MVYNVIPVPLRGGCGNRLDRSNDLAIIPETLRPPCPEFGLRDAVSSIFYLENQMLDLKSGELDMAIGGAARAQPAFWFCLVSPRISLVHL